MIALHSPLLPRLLALGVALALATPAVADDVTSPPSTAATAPQTWAAWGGTVGVRWNRDLAGDIGLRIDAPTGRLEGLSWREHERFELRNSGSLEFHVANGNLRDFVGGSVQARGGYVIRTADGAIDLSDFRLRPRSGDATILDVVGADGKAWFYIDRLMYELVDDNKVLAVRTMDLRISADLAARIGHPEVANWAIADMEMLTQVQQQGPGLVPAGSYKWHGTSDGSGHTYQADLFMQSFSAQYSRCDGCTGTSSTSRLVFTPSSTLRNNVNNGTSAATIPADPIGTSSALYAADIPWYTKFSGNFEPYSNDQHPYLIWNIYRFNADGSVDQIGRSGVKHAFLTINSGCLENPGSSHVLGRGCSDTYGTGNNDSNSDLGPRSEIIPASNQWGRCGSIYDTNCDGVANSSGNNSYSQRLIVAESQVAASLNAGATYLFESWYLAREDINIYNSMATKSFSATWNGSTWSVGGNANYRLGPAIDRWVDPVAPAANSQSTEFASGEGHVKVAVKASDLGNGSWRYDYAVMNLDFSRPYKEGAEPNLRVVHNFGLDRFSVAAPGVTISDIVFSDGDLVASNNWTGTATANGIEWSAPVNPTPPANTPAVLNPLNWGTLYRFSFVANSAPAAGAGFGLHVAQAGTPESLEGTLLGPTPLLPDVIFQDGFEVPTP